jgi:three-Cys-motif partner protein
MGDTTKTFFDAKKDWSIAKDDLLRCYLRPYMNKLFHSGRMNVFIDCFAGAGKFGNQEVDHVNITDDQVPVSYGSPLIALKEIQRSLYNTKSLNPKYTAYFIEKEYCDKLHTTLQNSQFSGANYRIMDGNYQEQIHVAISEILRQYGKPNLLCYLDPFGVKDLKLKYLEELNNYELNSFELLINFNSFGFFRYACGASNIAIREQELRDPGEILERSPMTKREGARDRLAIFDEIIGSRSWRRVIDSYNDSRLNGYQAERLIAGLHRKQLKRRLGFEYVLSIPIRINDSFHPKYRMIYATNHEDGAMVMGDIMHQRQHYLFDQYSITRNGCKDLFDLEDFSQESCIEDCVLEFLEAKGEIGGTIFYAKFYDRYFLTSRLGETLRILEEQGRISIRRNPPTTKTNRPSKFLKEDQSHKLFIKLIK